MLCRWRRSLVGAICCGGRQSGRASTNARFIVLDPNGEYLNCFDDLRHQIDIAVYGVDPPAGSAVKQLRVPAWMWNSQEWAALLSAAPATQRPLLVQALRVLRGAALAGAPGGDAPADFVDLPEASEALLLSAHIRAQRDYLQSFRAAGVQGYGAGAKMFELHNSLERLAEDATLHAQNFDGDLATSLQGLTETATRVYGRRRQANPRGGFYKQGFVTLILPS